MGVILAETGKTGFQDGKGLVGSFFGVPKKLESDRECPSRLVLPGEPLGSLKEKVTNLTGKRVAGRRMGEFLAIRVTVIAGEGL